MKLYYTPGACSLSPHIVLNELGIPHELEKVDLRGKKTETGKDYLTANPKGYVPALQLDNGEILTEGPAIVQYLGDHKPGSKLVPPTGTLPRYRLIEMLNFISTELHKNYSPLFNPATHEAHRKAVMDNLTKRYEHLNQVLQDRPYLLGEEFSAADVYLFVVTTWAQKLNFDLSKWPAVQKFQERVAARPAVQKSLKEEGLI